MEMPQEYVITGRNGEPATITALAITIGIGEERICFRVFPREKPKFC